MGQTSGVRALGVVLVFLVSGCVGSSAGTESPGDEQGASVITATSDPTGDEGSIVGTVIDDAIAPLTNAQVAIVDLNLVATTAEDGTFAFQGLVPGTYKVAAGKLGYDSVAQAVTVQANEEVSIRFILTPLAIVESWAEILGPFSWFFDCRVGTPVVTGPCTLVVSTPNDNSSKLFKMTEDVQDFVGEMRWSPGSFATSKALRMSFSYQGRPSTHWYCTATSPSPLQWNYNMEEGCLTPAYCGIGASQGTGGEHQKPNTKETLLMYTNTPFGCANANDPTRVVELSLQQRLEAAVTMFHNGLKPEVYTVFADT